MPSKSNPIALQHFCFGPSVRRAAKYESSCMNALPFVRSTIAGAGSQHSSSVAASKAMQMQRCQAAVPVRPDANFDAQHSTRELELRATVEKISEDGKV